VASTTHVAQIEEYFTTRFGAEELEALTAFLERIEAAGDGPDCAPPD
jgi:hypothetical protein